MIKTDHGIHFIFENGCTFSVQIEAHNYCDNHDSKNLLGKQTSCANAEIAAWSADGTWFVFEDGDVVRGYTTTDQIAFLMRAISKHGVSAVSEQAWKDYISEA